MDRQREQKKPCAAATTSDPACGGGASGASGVSGMSGHGGIGALMSLDLRRQIGRRYGGGAVRATQPLASASVVALAS